MLAHARNGRLAIGVNSPNHSNVEFIYLDPDPEAFSKEAKALAVQYLKAMKRARIEVGKQPVGITIKCAPALAKRIVAELRK